MEEKAVLPVIPETITVHLGSPSSNAPNVTVGFTEYLKNVASNEIYPTWGEEALKANIYAITSFVLNRIYTEYYPSRGYNFDITSDTAFDQAFRQDGEIFENISQIVDTQFNTYIVRDGFKEPLFAQFCSGTTSTCEGLSQWGTVELERQGLNALEILKRYYGDDITLVSAPVGNTESYPGFPLSLGSSGNAVKTIQTELNRISVNYPAIPKIANEDGVFGVDTERAVLKFQQTFSLTPDGIVGKATWYKIKRYYVAVKSLSDLKSEGITADEVAIPYPTILAPGSTGTGVTTLQYYLKTLSYFNPALPPVAITGLFDIETENAVREFQKFYGINVTGRVGSETWRILDKTYREAVAALPQDYNAPYAKFYPGYVLSLGQNGKDVENLQTYLVKISERTGKIPMVSVTGYYGEATQDAVIKYQEQNGINPSGVVGPVTWSAVALEYDALI